VQRKARPWPSLLPDSTKVSTLTFPKP
jgi:hypothetical protein